MEIFIPLSNAFMFLAVLEIPSLAGLMLRTYSEISAKRFLQRCIFSMRKKREKTDKQWKKILVKQIRFNLT